MSNSRSDPAESEPQDEYDLSLPGYDTVATGGIIGQRSGSSSTKGEKKPKERKSGKRWIFAVAIPLIIAILLLGIFRTSITAASVMQIIGQTGLETDALASALNVAIPFTSTTEDPAPNQQTVAVQLPTPTAQAEAPLCIVNHISNVRDGPGVTYTIVGQRSPGDRVDVISHSDACEADGETWYQIADGQWVASFLVDCTGDMSVLSSDVGCLVVLPTVTPAP